MYSSDPNILFLNWLTQSKQMLRKQKPHPHFRHKMWDCTYRKHVSRKTRKTSGFRRSSTTFADLQHARNAFAECPPQCVSFFLPSFFSRGAFSLRVMSRRNTWPTHFADRRHCFPCKSSPDRRLDRHLKHLAADRCLSLPQPLPDRKRSRVHDGRERIDARRHHDVELDIGDSHCPTSGSRRSVSPRY